MFYFSFNNLFNLLEQVVQRAVQLLHCLFQPLVSLHVPALQGLMQVYELRKYGLLPSKQSMQVPLQVFQFVSKLALLLN